MKKLVISNKGEIPLHMLSHLGISTSRNDSSKIGQFGSGAKHGILTALRHGIDLEIWSGQNKILPRFEKMKLDPSVEELVLYFNNERITTSLTRGFGKLDWEKDISLALREFFSNAIDQGETPQSCYTIINEDIGEIFFPAAGSTSIILPYTGEIDKFIRNLSEWYVSSTIEEAFTPHSNKTGLCYLKGVKIGEINFSSPALLNYNFSEIPLNESRCVDGDILRTYASKILVATEDSLKTVFRNISKNYYETRGISAYHIDYYDRTVGARIRNAWQSVHGNAYPILADDAKWFTAKDINHIVVPFVWYTVFSCSTVGITFDKSTVEKTESIKILPATEEMQLKLNQAWNILEKVNMTHQAKKPEVFAFSEIMSAGAQKLGFYAKDKVYLNIDEPASLQTVFEELAHHITGAGDNSRDLQDFAFRLAQRLANRLTI